MLKGNMNRRTKAGIETTSTALNTTISELAKQCGRTQEVWWTDRMTDALLERDAEQIQHEWIHIVLSGYNASGVNGINTCSLLREDLNLIAADMWVQEARELHTIQDTDIESYARRLLRERAGQEHMRNQDPGAGIAFAIACDEEHQHEMGRYLIIAIREYCESEYERERLDKGARVKRNDREKYGESAVQYLADVLLRSAEQQVTRHR